MTVPVTNYGLSNDEIDSCREAFMKFDKDNSGTIDLAELKETLSAMGQKPTDEELFLMISQVDDDGSGEIEFSEFLKLILSQKLQRAELASEVDLVDAFMALGGNSDKSGCIKTDKLRRIIEDFGLLIDIEGLIVATDLDNSGFIDFHEFKHMMAV
mmetsp:Transcript_1472/g.2108  ORF Transcript_1472/g.2108 Transcript_1472/m.2108 type:complete len:156 (+) Transcript_1472:237-704(+)|eukprot:CAMPEP_0196580932 /NCGR_PEP_ID=MMETSP1081-20130531/31567_1 /TAXON_ID=36882 /ORGANISM="Pyramimonas amylifera, Strain CCMP720" /LENGTH=155 /DNA_ID=CAMNT_0041900971 /DNA_START=225 /DNA_END=692 /DNA_ORIENTATION=-